MGSAKANSAAFSSRQKYCERNSSCRQTTWAPCAAASRIFQRAFSRFWLGSSAQLICTRPTRNLAVLTDCIVPLWRRKRRPATRHSGFFLGPDQEAQRHSVVGADQPKSGGGRLETVILQAAL